jgi:hypothetical protein
VSDLHVWNRGTSYSSLSIMPLAQSAKSRGPGGAALTVLHISFFVLASPQFARRLACEGLRLPLCRLPAEARYQAACTRSSESTALASPANVRPGFGRTCGRALLAKPFCWKPERRKTHPGTLPEQWDRPDRQTGLSRHHAAGQNGKPPSTRPPQACPIGRRCVEQRGQRPRSWTFSTPRISTGAKMCGTTRALLLAPRHVELWAGSTRTMLRIALERAGVGCSLAGPCHWRKAQNARRPVAQR